jgi:hypothetical protein
MKKLPVYLLLFPFVIVMLFSCKKDKDETPTNSVPTATLTAAATGGAIVSAQMQNFMMSSIAVAADSGHTFDFPQDTTLKRLKSAITDYTWNGPDAEGWYWRYFSGEYIYSERLHLGDTIQYIMDISYSGGDGSYECKTTTKYIKKVKDGKTLYDGYGMWEEHVSGYNSISRWDWRIYFTDWNPLTSAGIYDWYWGVYENSGGNTIPYHRFEHLEAMEITDPENWLHCQVIYYDDSGVETWRFEYDTPWAPVSMPVIPGWSK